MKKRLLFAAAVLFVSAINGQGLPADNLLATFTLKTSKFDEWLAKKKFFFSSTAQKGDTLVKIYTYKPEIKKNKPADSVKRSVIKKDIKDEFTITYNTTSQQEAELLKIRLKAAGFYCNAEKEPEDGKPLLYQLKDETITISAEIKDSSTAYSFLFYKKSFPAPEDIYYADDLLCFTSHEYLVHYFGEENVKKDIYYFSGDELARCSVLFLNTARQVVFIWKDEVNKRGIGNLLFGGQQKLKSLINSDKFIAESDWVFKSGVHAGMPLYELRLLNGNDLKFYGANSANAGIVVADSTGKINFKKEEVVLGCVNCTEGRFASAAVLNADAAISEGKILFVLSVILNPDPASRHNTQSVSQPVATK